MQDKCACYSHDGFKIAMMAKFACITHEGMISVFFSLRKSTKTPLFQLTPCYESFITRYEVGGNTCFRSTLPHFLCVDLSKDSEGLSRLCSGLGLALSGPAGRKANSVNVNQQV